MVAGPSRPDQLALPSSFKEAVEAGVLAGYFGRRWRRAGEFSGWLTEDQLPSLTIEQALQLYRASGGTRTAEFKANPIEEVRDSLDFLLYDNIKLEGRFDECVSGEGAYQLAGTGKEFASYLLCLREPSLLAVWNGAAERALRSLGLYPETLRRGHWGVRYLDLLEVMQRVRFRFGLPDFPAVDQFNYWLNRASKTTAT